MKIKKVDDKSMIIHTKQKAKIHTHEPKQASIKGSNIYTVDRDPTKKSADKGNYRKSTVHQVHKEGLISKYRKTITQSSQSICSCTNGIETCSILAVIFPFCITAEYSR